MTRLRTMLAASALFTLALAPLTAHASGATEADATRLSGKSTQKWNLVPGGKSDRYGHAEVLVNAPYDAVKQQVMDFGHYREFAPSRFKQSRVTGHTDQGQTEVYMQFSALHGLVSLWTVLRFDPARAAGEDTEIVEGKFVRGGNISDGNVFWTLERVDDDFTVVKCDILLKPDIPAPQSALDEELRDAAQQAVDGVRNSAQGNSNVVPWSKDG